MTKNKPLNKTTTIQSVLVSLPKPDGTKSPFYDLATRFGFELSFHPFVAIEGIAARDFRKQKIDISQFSSVILTSRHAIDHFFRMCDEMRISISQNQKYFCISEAVALYLQKFINYRKRKVFFAADGTIDSLIKVLDKHKNKEQFLYPCSETFDSVITNWLEGSKCVFARPVLYTVVNNDLTEVVKKNYDIICLFTPGGVRSLMASKPAFNQKKTLIAAYGFNTFKAVEVAGLTLDIKAPEPNSPSIISALEKYLQQLKK